MCVYIMYPDQYGTQMKKIVFCSFKGGTAKTSNALNIGACLATFHNKRVLLIDFDSQANLSSGLGLGPDNDDTMVCVLQGRKPIESVIQNTSIPNLSIIPGNTFLGGIECAAPLVSDLYAHERFRKSLIGLDYDYCFIDTPPSLGWLTQSAFLAADHSIICAIPEPYSILALNRLKEYHRSIQGNHPISCLGVILALWDNKGITNHVFVQAIHDSFSELLFDSKIRRDISVNRAILKGKSVFQTHSSSRAAIDYYELTNEFLNRMT